MATTNSFKAYERGVRIQLIEESFASGMKYSNAPLAEGFYKTLVNFDLDTNGEVLMPRPGLRCTTRTPGLAFGSTLQTVKSTTLDDNVTCYQCVTADENEHINVVSFKPGDGTMQTHNSEKNGFYKKPIGANIHGYDVDDVENAKALIGTFAYDDSYYCFLQNPETKHTALHNTKYNTDKFIFEEITPREVTPKQAVSWGYNMLKDNPYMFKNEVGLGAIQLQGLLPYASEGGEVQMSPEVNQDVVFEAFYTAPAGSKYSIVWDWKETAADVWYTFKKDVLTMPADASEDIPHLYANYSAPVASVIVRISAYKIGADDVVEDAPEQVLTVGLNFDKNAYGSTANIDPKVYDLSTATGMTYWKNRLILYGIGADRTVVFFSEVNDPSYFPYPNNVELFDEPVIHMTPFLDNLLAFTATKMYLITLNEDGMSWTTKVIQNNLRINPWDANLIKTVKNMAFFKSGNYYYMIVPKANSLTGELTIAPVSKNLESFFDNFQANVADLFKIVYNYSDELKLLDYYNFLDYDDMYNVYTFETVLGTKINMAVLYNTIARAWRIHFYEATGRYHVCQQDSTKKGIYANTYSDKDNTYIQFLEFNKSEQKDMYYPTGEDDIYFKNYQYFDTGYREHGTDFKKRYRELQFKINNVSQQNMKAYLAFYIDGEERKTMFKYTPTLTLVGNEQHVIFDRVPVTEAECPASTVLAETKQDVNCWQLDVSAFPDNDLYKIRVPVSGKGYAPRTQFMCLNQQNYELMNVSYVYRQMYSR